MHGHELRRSGRIDDEFALAQKYWSKADPDLAELRDIRTRPSK
jgi:hypothetical protein